MVRFLGTFLAVFALSAVCMAQPGNQARQPNAGGAAENDIPVYVPLTYLPRNMSREGDYKIVVVPATNARQARLDAQTYHLGWDALGAREGQSRVMFEVLLRKRAPYVPGTPPVTRRIPR